MKYWYDALIIHTSSYEEADSIFVIVPEFHKEMFDIKERKMLNIHNENFKDRIKDLIEKGKYTEVFIPKGWGGFNFGEHNPIPLYTWCYIMPESENNEQFLLIGFSNYQYDKNDFLDYEHPKSSPYLNKIGRKTQKDTFIKNIKFITDKLYQTDKLPNEYIQTMTKELIKFYYRKRKKDGEEFSDLGTEEEYPDLEKQFYNYYEMNDDGVVCLIPLTNDEEQEDRKYFSFILKNDILEINIDDVEEEDKRINFLMNMNKDFDEQMFNFSINNGEDITEFTIKENNIIASINDKTKFEMEEDKITIKIDEEEVATFESGEINFFTGDDEIVLWSELKEIINKIEGHIHPVSSGACGASLDLPGIGGSFNSAKSQNVKSS